MADFKRDGFLVVRGLFDASEMQDIAAWTDEVEVWPETAGQHMMYFETSLKSETDRILNRLENFYPFHEGFRALFDGEKLRSATSDLLGEEAVLYKDKINFKLPGGDGFELHQDQQAGWGTYTDFFITALVSIDAATEENGCLELVAVFSDGMLGEEWKPMTEEDSRAKRLSRARRNRVTLSSSILLPARLRTEHERRKRRVLYVTYNAASAGDYREQYYADKRKSFPPDIERDPSKEYIFRV